MRAVHRSATSSNASVIKITLQANRVSVLATYGHEQHSAATVSQPLQAMQELMRSRKPDLSAKRAAALSISGLTAGLPASLPAAASHTELRSPSSIMLLAAACTASQAWAATFPTAAWHRTHLCIEQACWAHRAASCRLCSIVLLVFVFIACTTSRRCELL